MTRPTIDDVARLAGVSIATVSRCLHTPDVVASATRDRVLTAVRQTGYTLNMAAQSLRQRRSNTVLVVVPDIGNTFFSEILGGIEAEASAAGLTILIGNTGRSRGREESYTRYLLNGRADGALLLAEPQARWFDIPVRSGQIGPPIVSISARSRSACFSKPKRAPMAKPRCPCSTNDEARRMPSQAAGRFNNT